MTETESVVPKLKRKQKGDINIPILNIILVFLTLGTKVYISNEKNKSISVFLQFLYVKEC